MIGWIFKNDEALAADTSASAAGTTATTGAAAKGGGAVPAFGDWSLKLQAAMGDDTALLTLALAGAPLDVKLAAVGALATEAALKLAEREFRDHDRRVHRLAKQRLGVLVALRETGEKAARLIEAAKALLDEPLLAVNRLVELDRAWQALDAGALDAAQRVEFETLLTQLSTLTRERADEALKRKRWTAQAQLALSGLQAACFEAAAGTHGRSGLAAASAAARQAGDGAAAGDDSAVLRDALAGALQTWAQLDERLAVLDELLQASSVDEPVASTDADPPGDPAGRAAPRQDAALRWQQLAPLADARLGDLLNRRFEQWQQAQEDARQARKAQRRDQARARQHAARNERIETLASVLERAEVALADGHLADTHKHLVEIDEWLHGGASAGTLRARIDALQAGYAQLKGWQHWGGGRARDELVLQAEALAAATNSPGDARTVKLTTRQQAEVIDDMRARWKELDRLGGATSRSLWQRFEAALKAAYQPVAAHVAAQRAAREQNLQSRQQLIAALDMLVLPEVDGGDATPDWRKLAGALDHFRTEWRKLGPLEHTVPHKAQDKLVERMHAAVARLESPLQEARRGARVARERLIARASALGAEALAGGQGRELVDRVRELQADWQQQARALPLARGDENALWAEFKTAIDAIFSARDAVFSARDAEFRAHGAERLALIGRLEALSADTAPAELKRALAEVDAAWQRAGPAPRSDAAALDARFRNAREAAVQYLGSSAQRRWHATCDALAAKLALCEELESGADPADARAVLTERWSAVPALPAPWEQALAARAGLSGVAAAGKAPGALGTDELLLQAEAAWGLQSPAAFDAARRLLKLQAMKAAMEGRRPTTATPSTPEFVLAALLGRRGLDVLQRQRLGVVLAALRQRGPIGGVAGQPAAGAGNPGADRRAG
ncbi:MAG: DUF349 domain-containing protein [Rubrivivax sp.]|nr:DUF349 domain-containing protein [Rubrivivax sp.]